MICTDIEAKCFEISSRYCEKLGDEAVTVRERGDGKDAVYCMQSQLCGGGCVLPKAEKKNEYAD